MASQRIFIPPPQITDTPPNSHVFWYPAEYNARHYGAYIHTPSGTRQRTQGSKFVTWNYGRWYNLAHRQEEELPYLGTFRPDIAETDQQTGILTPCYGLPRSSRTRTSVAFRSVPFPFVQAP